jgi:hypothetical protein
LTCRSAFGRSAFVESRQGCRDRRGVAVEPGALGMGTVA